MIGGRQSISRKQNETKPLPQKGYNKKGYTCMTVLQQYLRRNASKEEQQNVVYFFFYLVANRFINDLLKHRLKFFIFSVQYL